MRIRQREGGAIEKIAAGVAAVNTVIQTGQYLRDKYTAKAEYVTTVLDTDNAYEEVLAHVLKQIPPDDQRSVELITESNSRPGEAIEVRADGTPTRRSKHVTWAFDGTKHCKMSIGGHAIRAVIVDEQIEDVGVMFARGRSRNRSLRFLAKSADGRDALHRWLEGIVESLYSSEERVPPMKLANGYGHWQHRGDIPVRALDTVILGAGVKEMVVDDLRKFLANEKMYIDLGIPFHRGYLLHGPPGTGKTSLARAIATEFKMALYYLPLSSMKKDTDLINVVSEVPAKSILLIEDIDTASVATSRDDSDEHASMSSLLNSLDGALTPHGLITVMSTNHREKLDDAVLRPGRVDVDAHIGYLELDQAQTIWTMAYGGPAPACIERLVGRAPGELVGVIIKNIDDPVGAECALLDDVLHDVV